ncbi:MAG: hypothetical protein NTX27_10040 [Verrucomicrobia bacterium]|nr:hypothetical protein [Verrucomicrobiota bacterium]
MARGGSRVCSGAGFRAGREQFLQNIKGQTTGGGIKVFSPNEMVNYASVHDDHCLWDKLLLSTPGVPENLRANMDKLAVGIVLTAQGVPFLHAGDEFLRSKNLEKNSYNSNDPRVNPLDWSLKSTNKEVFEFYRGMIALRKAHPAFRMHDQADVNRHLKFIVDAPDKAVAYLLKDHANGDRWPQILLVYNGNRQAREVAVPGTWTIVANDRKAGMEALGLATNTIQIEACSLVVAHTENRFGPARIERK